MKHPWGPRVLLPSNSRAAPEGILLPPQAEKGRPTCPAWCCTERDSTLLHQWEWLKQSEGCRARGQKENGWCSSELERSHPLSNRVLFLEAALSAEGKSSLLKTGRGVKRWKEGNRKGKPKNQAMKQKYGKREEKQFAHLAALCVGRKETDRVRASTCSL